MSEAIIVDLDGTLADNEHRRKYLDEGEEENWEKYYEGIRQDGLNEWCYEIVERFKDDHEIYLVTGREGTDEIREDSVAWLDQHDVYYDDLYFREEKDYRKDAEVKQEILYEEILENEDLAAESIDDILFAVDDRLQVIDMWRDLGITVLDCAGGEF